MKHARIISEPCTRCGGIERYGMSYNCVQCSKNKYANNGAAARERGRTWRQANRWYVLLAKVRKRATDMGVPFDLDIENMEMPSHCPVLGIPLVFSSGQVKDDSPTIDRVIPKLGYVRGNVQVISQRANRIKNDGTAEEHEKIAAWIREHDNSHLLD